MKNLELMERRITQAEGMGMAVMPDWKRATDILVLLVTLPIWLPLGILVALVIRLGSPGPVIFRQERVGHCGRRFTCYKFRTMRVNAEQVSHQSYVNNLIRSSAPMTKLDARKDTRLIPGGRWIRASGLDELPQLFNVICGEMSIVGPRPCIPYEYELYEPSQRRRFEAVPGLTGLWQVSGKNRTTFVEMVNLDIQYGQRMSFWLDLSILAQTGPAILKELGFLISQRAHKAALPTAAGFAHSTRNVHTQKVVL